MIHIKKIAVVLLSCGALMLNSCIKEPEPFDQDILDEISKGTDWEIKSFHEFCSDGKENRPEVYNGNDPLFSGIDPLYTKCRDYDDILSKRETYQKLLASEMERINDPENPVDKDTLNLALIHAAFVGNIDKLNQLIKLGADPDARNDEQRTALMIAARNAQPESVKALLAAGANPNAKDSSGRTALMLASGYVFNYLSVKELIKAGADVNAKSKEGESALHMTLTPVGADACITCLKDLIDAGADVDVKDSDESTPLLYAAKDCHYLASKLLVDAGADVNTSNQDGTTPLMYAVYLMPCGNYALYLLNAGANPNAKDKNGASVSYLFEHGNKDSEEREKVRSSLFFARAKRLFFF